MLVDEVAEYLGGASLGLVVGSNLWKVPVPETTSTTGPQVGVVEYAGRPALRAMGPSLGDPIAEVTRFQVGVIGQLDQYEETREMAESIYQALDNLANTSLPSSTGSRYLLIRALQPPFYMAPDDNTAQHHLVFNCEAIRERN